MQEIFERLLAIFFVVRAGIVCLFGLGCTANHVPELVSSFNPHSCLTPPLHFCFSSYISTKK